MRMLKQSGTRPVFFLLVLTSDHITGATGLTPTVTISKDGAAFATPAGTVAEIANGWYKLTPTSADTGSLGALLLHATGTGADPVDHIYQVVAYDPESATNLGLSNLDAAITSRMATYTQPTGFLASTFPTTIASTTNITAATGIVLSGVTHTGAVIPTVSAVTGLTASNLDATVSSRSTYAGGAVASVTAGVTVTTNNDKTGYGLSAAAVQAIWDALTSALTTVGSIGKLLVDNLNATISSRMATYTQPTGFLAATFPATVASTTNITAATGVVLSGVTHTGAVIPTVTTVGTLTTYTGNTPQTGDAFARLGAPVGASHSADVAAVKAVLPSALVSGRIDASVGAMASGVQTTASFAVGAIDNTVLSSNAEQAIADKTLATAVDGTITLRQLLQLIGASAVGKLSGAATTTVTIRNVSDTVNAVVGTVDADGNRITMTYTVT